MAKQRLIPEIINNYNVYGKGNKCIGVTGATTLPTMDAITETINGAGILGTYETSVPGQFGSLEQEINFRNLDEDVFSIMDPSEPVAITMRGSEQLTNRSTGALTYRPVRIVERGRLKSFDPGKLENGKMMESKVTLELFYYLIEVDGKVMLEYDKLNSVYKINGKDMLAKIKAYS